MTSKRKNANKPKKSIKGWLKLERFESIMELFASVLLGIAIQEFFSIMTQVVRENSTFIFSISLIALVYISLIFLLVYKKAETNVQRITRISVMLIFSIIPYIFQRTYGNVVGIDRLGIIPLLIILILSSLSLVIWAIIEKSKDKKWFLDVRVFVAIITIIVYLILIFGIPISP